MRTPIIFSFQQKVQALSMIKEKGLAGAVAFFSQEMAYPPHPMRIALEKLNRTNLLLEEGILEKNDYNLIIFTQKNYNRQPNPINPKYLNTLPTSLIDRIKESIPYLNQKYTAHSEYMV